jgi:hypothetical protein
LQHHPAAHRLSDPSGVKSVVNVSAVSMANQRSTFAKRRREQGLQDRARAKEQRRAARKNDPRPSGPQIAWDEAVRAVVSDDAETPTDAPPADPVVKDDPRPT